jgi:TrmH family RNA methyltransferase
MLSGAVPSRAPRRISSRKNPNIARYRAVARGEAPDRLLLDGPHIVADALAAGLPLESAAVLSTALERPEIRTLMADLEHAGVEVVITTPQVMAVVSPVRSSSSIVALASRPAADAERLYAGGASLVLIANDVQDPGNMGAIVRAAEAGRATSVVAAGACADPFGWKALRGSSGSALRLPIGVAPTAAAAIAEARRHGCRIIAAVPRGGRSLYDVDLRGGAAILIGGEGPGLDAATVELADERLTIPMQVPVESLNAAVAAAIVVYEALRQRHTDLSSRTR